MKQIQAQSQQEKHSKEYREYRNIAPKYLCMTEIVKGWGDGGSIWPPCGFSKNVLSTERVKPCFCVIFNIIISHIFPEKFIEIPQVVQKT